MKILHVSQNYYPSLGGPQYTMKHVSEKLVSYYGDDVQVATTNSYYGPETRMFKKIEPAIELFELVKITRLPFNRWHYPLIDFTGKVYGKVTGKPLPHAITKYRWNLDSPAIDKMMATSHADVIMATTIIYNFADYPMWRHKTKNPKPFVLYGAVHLHKALPENSPFIKRANCCDCYISNTEFERQELIKYGVDGSKIVNIGTGIEIEDFTRNEDEISRYKTELGIEEDDVVIGFIGRLVKGKGVAILIDAFRQLYAENKKVKLLLAGGTTDYVPQIKKVIEEEELPIILIENFDEKLKPLIYHSLDVFVLASQSESFGVVFLEAWVCKKPVIGTRIGAIESLLTEEKDSLLFTAGNDKHLCAQIKLLVNNKALRQKMGAAGYKKVVENYTWPVVVARYREAYKTGIENFSKQIKRGV
ncbi:MAG TPA: glycosyltransferase family 4 protein [Segetibacter sp.]|jgi:glycosyltransferase involved in cell wall biosynthesis